MRAAACHVLFASAQALAAASRPVLRPSTSAAAFDASNVAAPFVLPPASAGEQWRMFYYGNDGTWADPEVTPFLPTGKCGMALSDDGVAWARAGGCILGPGEPGTWDSLHVGVGLEQLVGLTAAAALAEVRTTQASPSAAPARAAGDAGLL